MEVKISMELAESLVTYLADRPWKEVAQGLPGLLQAIEAAKQAAKEEAKPKEE